MKIKKGMIFKAFFDSSYCEIYEIVKVSIVKNAIEYKYLNGVDASYIWSSDLDLFVRDIETRDIKLSGKWIVEQGFNKWLRS